MLSKFFLTNLYTFFSDKKWFGGSSMSKVSLIRYLQNIWKSVFIQWNNFLLIVILYQPINRWAIITVTWFIQEEMSSEEESFDGYDSKEVESVQDRSRSLSSVINTLVNAWQLMPDSPEKASKGTYIHKRHRPVPGGLLIRICRVRKGMKKLKEWSKVKETLKFMNAVFRIRIHIFLGHWNRINNEEKLVL